MIRSYTAIPAHAAFGVIMGYYTGLAKFDPGKRKVLIIRGLVLATVLHGFYDCFVFLYSCMHGMNDLTTQKCNEKKAINNLCNRVVAGLKRSGAKDG